VNPQATSSYLRGRYEWSKGSAPKACRSSIEYYEKAMALDPGDARHASGWPTAGGAIFSKRRCEHQPQKEGWRGEAVSQSAPSSSTTAGRGIAERTQEAISTARGWEGGFLGAVWGGVGFFFFGGLEDGRRSTYSTRSRSTQILHRDPMYTYSRHVREDNLAIERTVSRWTRSALLPFLLFPPKLIVNWNATSTFFLAGRTMNRSPRPPKRHDRDDPTSPLPKSALARNYEPDRPLEEGLEILRQHLSLPGVPARIARWWTP